MFLTSITSLKHTKKVHNKLKKKQKEVKFIMRVDFMFNHRENIYELVGKP